MSVCIKKASGAEDDQSALTGAQMCSLWDLPQLAKLEGSLFPSSPLQLAEMANVCIKW